MNEPLPDEQKRIIETYCTGFPEQNEDGVDLSLIRENLKLTPTERIRRADRRRRDMERLRRIGRRKR